MNRRGHTPICSEERHRAALAPWDGSWPAQSKMGCRCWKRTFKAGLPYHCRPSRHLGLCGACNQLRSSCPFPPPKLPGKWMSHRWHFGFCFCFLKKYKHKTSNFLLIMPYCRFCSITPAHQTLLGYSITQPMMWPHLMCVDIWHNETWFPGCHYHISGLNHGRRPSMGHSPTFPFPGSPSQGDIKHPLPVPLLNHLWSQF